MAKASKTTPAAIDGYCATIDAEGRVTGFYHTALHDVMPEGAIAIDEATWLDWSTNLAHRRWDGSTMTLVSCEQAAPIPPTPARELAKLDMLMPAWAEALIAWAGPAKATMPPEIRTILDQKKALRAQIESSEKTVTEAH